jgi:hypothetical protein
MSRLLRSVAHLLLLTSCCISGVAQHAPIVSADQIWKDLATGNHRYVAGETAPHDFVAQRKALVKS